MILTFYLRSTFVEIQDKLYIKRDGVCIGSCLAPVLSDLLLARRDRQLLEVLRDTSIVRIFCFVDDVLAIFNRTVYDDQEIDRLYDLIASVMADLVLTRELPKNQEIRFLDLRFHLAGDHVCWAYASRSQKGLLRFSSAHSKMVKRGVATAVLRNALKMSCGHQTRNSFKSQVGQL